MRVLIVSHYFYPENLPINYVAKILNKNGFEVEVLTGKPNYPNGRYFQGYGLLSGIKERIDNIEIHRLPVLPRGVRFRFFGLILNYLSFLLSASLIGPIILRNKKYDFIFIYGTSPLTNALPALLLGRIKTIPVLLWVQDLWPESIRAQGFKLHSSLTFILKKIMGFIYKRSDLVFCQSNSFVRRISSQFSIDSNKLIFL